MRAIGKVNKGVVTVVAVGADGRVVGYKRPVHREKATIIELPIQDVPVQEDDLLLFVNMINKRKETKSIKEAN